MEATGSGANHFSKEETPLICGLPDDIALLCLVRVPRTYHANLKCVSKRWRELVCGEEWRIIRKKYNLEETWIYALCIDRSRQKRGIPYYCCYVLDPYAPRKRWKRIQDLPPCIVQRQNMHFEVLGTKVYLIGGRDFTEQEWDGDSDYDIKKVTAEVYCYDMTKNSWSKSAPLSTPRCHFGSEVLDGEIYAVGSELTPDGRHTWEAYDPITNIWTARSDPHVTGRSIQSIVYNGKLYVRNSMYASDARGAVYDPSTGTWHDADTDLVLGWCEQAVVADGRLYTFKLSHSGLKLKMWMEDKKRWVLVAELHKFLRETPYRLVAIGKSIFFIGKRLATTELDVTNVGKGGELLISDLTGPNYEMSPMICKCMTI